MGTPLSWCCQGSLTTLAALGSRARNAVMNIQPHVRLPFEILLAHGVQPGTAFCVQSVAHVAQSALSAHLDN